MTSATELKDAGLRVTSPRLSILGIFEQAGPGRHYSAEDIYRIMLMQNIEVGQATVYRVVRQLEQAGILRRNSFEQGRNVYELNDGLHHDHLICLQCGTVKEFSDKSIELRQIIVAKELGFTLREHDMAIYGRCVTPVCPNKLAMETKVATER